MLFFKKKYVLIFLVQGMVHDFCYAISQEMRAKGFVYLQEIDPSIIASCRYYSEENFIGKRVRGCEKPVIIITKQAAQALKEVQEEVAKDGYSLVVYDAYRPQQAVDHFVEWSKETPNQLKKRQYYPNVDKEKVFELGYVAQRSGHTRGSTVDLTLIKKGNALCKIEEEDRELLDGSTIKVLKDGTVEMGSSFDLFHEVSHFDNALIDGEAKLLRTYLKEKMEKHGFKNYAEEWWHFTLINEPFSPEKEESYFNFQVE